MQKLSVKLVQMLVREGIISAESREIYEYGAMKMLSCIVIFGVTLFLGLLLDLFVQTIVFLCFFYFLRIFIGGYHAKTSARCFVGFQLIYFLQMIFVKYMFHSQLNDILLIFCLILDGIVIFVCAPVNHPNMDLSETEKRHARKMSLILYLLETALLICLKFVSAEYMIYGFMGFNTAIVLMIFAKLTGQEVKCDEGSQKESFKAGI